MKIKLLSDIHLEYYPYSLKYDGEDVLILAGDISSSSEETLELILEYLSLTKSPQVILVLGNHDYYGKTISKTHKYWESFKLDRFTFLQNSSIVIDGIRFFGSTMWTDMYNNNKKVMEICGYIVKDYTNIKKFHPLVSSEIHKKSRNVLMDTLRNSKEKVVVITHHLPTYKSIHKNYENNPVNPSFASTDLDDIVKHEKVIMWIHGHTHGSFNYMDGNTIVLCNPRGKAENIKGEIKTENLLFNENFLIEI